MSDVERAEVWKLCDERLVDGRESLSSYRANLATPDRKINLGVWVSLFKDRPPIAAIINIPFRSFNPKLRDTVSHNKGQIALSGKEYSEKTMAEILGVKYCDSSAQVGAMPSGNADKGGSSSWLSIRCRYPVSRNDDVRQNCEKMVVFTKTIQEKTGLILTPRI